MSNTKWDAFIKDMELNHASAFEEYGAGSGGELTPKGKYPPKMASYGSSSRMIYNLCKDIPNFHFEYQLPTRVGGVANLDGFIEANNKYFFVEAKCREPYGVKSHLIENKYQDLYKYIAEDKACNLSIQIESADLKMNVTFWVGTTKILSFDIKQMICHLLGISCEILEYSNRKENNFFISLL